MDEVRLEAAGVHCDRYSTGTCLSLCDPVLRQIGEKKDERKIINSYRTC